MKLMLKIIVFIVIILTLIILKGMFGVSDKITISKSGIVRIHDALQKYKTTFSELPPNEDPQTVSKSLVMGDNPGKVIFLYNFKKIPITNSVGELTDYFGTPYHYRFNTNEHYVISAGKDKKFGTKDDTVYPSE